MIAEQQLNQWGQIVAQAWQDDAFNKRLIANPASVLTEQGINIPTQVQVRVVENTPTLLHLTLPARTQEAELSDDQLEAVAGGNKAPVASKLPKFIEDFIIEEFARAAFGNTAASAGGLAHETPHQSAPRPQ